jgi:hypothetical protein
MPFALSMLVALGLMVARTNQQLSGIASDGFASPATAGPGGPQYLAPTDLPTLLFYDGIAAWDELSVGRKRESPSKFYYRIIPSDSPLDPKHQPWARTDRVAPGTKCAELLANSYIRIRTIIDSEGSRKIPLEPVPLQVEWKGNVFKTDTPGINKNRVSTCCDAATCTDRCLQFDTGPTWLLEISAPQWGVDTSYDPVEYRSNQGGGYFKPAEQSDPGMWPVLRVPCVYCPLLNCITNCSNGEYATGYSEYLVRALIEHVQRGARMTGFCWQEENFQVRKIECKPCTPGTWNTCVDKETCRWYCPFKQQYDRPFDSSCVGRHIPSGPGEFNLGRNTIQPIRGGPGKLLAWLATIENA